MKRASIIAAILFSFTSLARAEQQSIWTLTTADLQSQRIALRGIDASGIQVGAASGGERRTIPFDQFLQLDRTQPAARRAGRFLARTIDGDAFAGEAVSTSGDSIVWKSAALGEMKLSMRNLESIARAGAADQPGGATTAPTEDEIVLQNGDTTRGVVVALDPQAASIQPSSGGDTSRIPNDSIAAIHFAKTTATRVAPTGFRFRIAFTDGTKLRARSIRSTDNTLKIDGISTDVSLDTVESIEQIDGPVLWLSSLTPSEIVQQPYLERSWPTRMNASVTGGPIKFGQRTFSRGIGVHSYSRISWPIEASAVAFRTQYAIDGALPYADVTVRIKLDGKAVYEQKSVRAGTISPLVELDTDHASTITLEVDYGENDDVQDRFIWIEPALLKYKSSPATQPVSSPTSAPTSAPTAAPKMGE